MSVGFHSGFHFAGWTLRLKDTPKKEESGLGLVRRSAVSRVGQMIVEENQSLKLRLGMIGMTGMAGMTGIAGMTGMAGVR